MHAEDMRAQVAALRKLQHTERAGKRLLTGVLQGVGLQTGFLVEALDIR